VIRALLLAFAVALGLGAQDRFLDAPRPARDGPRLVLFNPTVHNIRCLAALREKGLLAVPGLTVVGVYHVLQKEDFRLSRAFAAEHGYDWLKFHAVAAPLAQVDLFRRNACTPEFEAVAAKADGAVFFGGPDIPAAIFHQKTNFLSDVDDPHRNLLELSAIFHLLGGTQDPGFRPLLASRPDFPVLGICLGFQSLNVATGGDLAQDIWTGVYGVTSLEDAVALGPELWHNNPYRRLFPQEQLTAYNFHTLQLRKGRFLKAAGFGPADHPRVLSSHHQAVLTVAEGWSVLATSRDGRIVEAMEHDRFPNVLGVQFHPEHFLLWEPGPGFRQKPGDPPVSYHATLEGTPRSLEFNKAVWAWMGARLKGR
jgi:putative glutamine amidotransferase